MKHRWTESDDQRGKRRTRNKTQETTDKAGRNKTRPQQLYTGKQQAVNTKTALKESPPSSIHPSLFFIQFSWWYLWKQTVNKSSRLFTDLSLPPGGAHNLLLEKPLCTMVCSYDAFKWTEHEKSLPVNKSIKNRSLRLFFWSQIHLLFTLVYSLVYLVICTVHRIIKGALCQR